MTVISAPAGSGKTSLLRAWADRPGQPRRLAVLQVQRDQHDAQQFWLALLDAVRHATGADSGAELPAATPDFNAPAMADRVLSELADARGGVTLVIDDLHELHLAGSTRSAHPAADEPSPARARDPDHASRCAAAAFISCAWPASWPRSARPTCAFPSAKPASCSTPSDIALSAAGAALLHQRTEGWAAGLRLAAISLAGHPDPERFVTEFSGSDRTVAEYLLAEMLDRQPPDVQDLLLRTSLLDRVNGELADLLTGRPGSEQILLDLEDANAFVESLDPERTWFRYHHLFADLLRLELRRTLPAEIPALHRRAAGWFTRHGQVAEAIRHTQAAGDWPEAARLLADHSFSLTLDGQAQTMQALLRAFPPGADHPELALVRAMGDLAQGRLDEAAAHLAVAETYAETTPPDRQRRLRVAIASLRLSLARRRGHLAGVIEQARFLASPVTGPSDEDIALGSDLRAVALMNLGTAEAWSSGACRTPNATSGRAPSWPGRSAGRTWKSAASRSSVSRRCPPLVRHDPAALPRGDRARRTVRLGHGTGDRARADDARRHDGAGWVSSTRASGGCGAPNGPCKQTPGRTSGCCCTRRPGCCTLAAAAATRRSRSSARPKTWRSQLAGSQALASQVTGWLLATQARLGLTGEARAALAALDDERASSGEIRNARAVICLAEGDPAGALAAVADVLDGTAPVLGYVTVVEAHLLAGLAHRELGDQRAANQAAERALALAESDRLVLPFAMTGSAGLLEALPRHQTAHAALLADILDVLHGSSPAAKEQSSLPPAEELSPGELRVLRYLPTNLSRPEIAGELSVSLNTVSTHLRSIYAKLQVRDRSSAVRRARELRLLARRPHALARR